LVYILGYILVYTLGYSLGYILGFILGYFFGDLFTNSSGHPGSDSRKIVCELSLQVTTPEKNKKKLRLLREGWYLKSFYFASYRKIVFF
jgi:membrane protein YqaA with SNARE-associated domain